MIAARRWGYAVYPAKGDCGGTSIASAETVGGGRWTVGGAESAVYFLKY